MLGMSAHTMLPFDPLVLLRLDLGKHPVWVPKLVLDLQVASPLSNVIYFHAPTWEVVGEYL